MEEDDLSYLQPGFNPSTLTVARLRSILLTHGINYSSSAKKGDLIQVFNDELTPRAKKILSAHRRIQRSSRGIEDAASSVASTIDADEEEMPPPKSSPVKRGRGRPRKTERSPTDDESEQTLVTPAPPSTAKKVRSKSAKNKERRTVSRTATTPAARQSEDSDPDTWKRYGKDSPFSAENPFQSGGSSPPDPQTTKRRRTDGPTPGDDKKHRASSSRRKTDNTSVLRHSSTVVDVPIAVAQDGVEAGEEFEPSERAELELERTSDNTAVIPVRRSRARGGNGILLPLVTGLLVALLSVPAYFWRQEKLQVGYCGIGHQSDLIGGVEIPEWAEKLRPTCEPCPQHGICFHNLETKCEKGFVLKQHPLSLGGIVPLPPTCEADGETPRRVKYVADAILDQLREKNAQAECGGVDKEGNLVKSPEIAEEELKESARARKHKKWTTEEFNDFLDAAFPEMEGREEVVISTDEEG
jgi:Man1-Src1p-C-terminal domain/HeH/LEM domain